MTAPSSDDVERVHRYLLEYITAKRYPPSQCEIAQAMGWGITGTRTRNALEALQQDGRVRMLPRKSGPHNISLTAPPAQQIGRVPIAATANESTPATARSPELLTVENAIDWRRMLKEFRGVAVTRLKASQIARYYRKRCVESTVEQAEREANVLLGLRFPELFLERRQALGQLSDFVDIQRSKRGCKSCGAKFVKIKPNQRYCSARCRHREKRRRREATPHGQKLKSQQNKRYRYKYAEREHDRKRQWRLNHPKQYSVQKEREANRRSLNAKWNASLYRGNPPELATVLKAASQGRRPRSTPESQSAV